ncbi:MAG: hypothetical protein HWE27_08535 [Gammaproteobacteria bacterium]|nr:hypothetical protein [Gammaproteobacteria bacterium]
MNNFNIPIATPKLASSIVMCRPFHFGFNQQTGADNTFQHNTNSPEQVQKQAMKEFDNAVSSLQNIGVEVLILEHPINQNLPDAIFPNNWFTTHSSGELLLYPMKTPNRQLEVEPERLKNLFVEAGYEVNNIIRLDQQANSRVLEGTGAIVFDHWQHQAFAGLSERCDVDLFNQLCDSLNYSPISFKTAGSEAIPFYHTNVMLSIGHQFSVICSDAIDNNQRSSVINQLQSSDKTIIDVSLEQAEQSFCCNILQLENCSGESIIAMSKSAYNGFNNQQVRQLEKLGSLLIADIPTIEYIGGGSLRCMMAENFLPRLTP